MKSKEKEKEKYLDLLIGLVDRAVRYVEQTTSKPGKLKTSNDKKALALKTFDTLAIYLEVKNPGEAVINILIEGAVQWMEEGKA